MPHFDPLAPHQQALISHSQGDEVYEVQSFFWEGYVWTVVSEKVTSEKLTINH